MKKALQYHNCFVCGKESKNGLKVDFEITETGARACYMPKKEFEGFCGVAHGGILCALLDEIMWKAINGQTGAVTMTAKMEIRFKRPAPIGKNLTVEGFVVGRKRTFFEAKGVISDNNGSVLAEATGLFMEMDADASAQLSKSLSYK